MDVPDEDVEGYLEQAVELANSCWGSLACSMYAQPSFQKAHPEAFERALEQLRFGSIVVNGPAPLSFITTNLSWGAFPGNPLDDIGSGNCAVHNTLLLDHPEKSILYCPWRFKPLPFWFHTLTNKTGLLKQGIKFILHPSICELLKMLPQIFIAKV